MCEYLMVPVNDLGSRRRLSFGNTGAGRVDESAGEV